MEQCFSSNFFGRLPHGSIKHDSCDSDREYSCRCLSAQLYKQQRLSVKSLARLWRTSVPLFMIARGHPIYPFSLCDISHSYLSLLYIPTALSPIGWCINHQKSCPCRYIISCLQRYHIFSLSMWHLSYVCAYIKKYLNMRCLYLAYTLCVCVRCDKFSACVWVSREIISSSSR